MCVVDILSALKGRGFPMQPQENGINIGDSDLQAEETIGMLRDQRTCLVLSLQ
jgi:hypothetical protein